MDLSVTTCGGNVSVAIVNYNGKHFLEETLDRVYAHCVDIHEVLLIDNSSTDGSVEFVAQHYPHVRILQRAANDGPGQARNLAIRACSTDLVLVLDNDVSPCQDCLPLLQDALLASPESVLAMPTILYHDRPGIVQYSGADAHFMGTVIPLCHNLHIDQLDRKTELCTSMISAAFLVNRKTLGSHILFNENLFIYQEDHEAAYRAGISGHSLLKVPSAWCLHREGTVGLSIRETGKVQPLRTRHTVFNRWYILATLYQWQTLFRYLPSLLCYELVTLSGALVQGWLGDWLWAGREYIKRMP